MVVELPPYIPPRQQTIAFLELAVEKALIVVADSLGNGGDGRYGYSGKVAIDVLLDIGKQAAVPCLGIFGHDLPFSANCWLDKGEEVGKYPTGGPVAKVMEVWRYVAPFGFGDMGQPFNDISAYLFGVDVSDPLLQTPQNVEEYRWCASALNDMMPLLTEAYGTNDLQAVISEKMDMTPIDPSKGFAGMMANSDPEKTNLCEHAEVSFFIGKNVFLWYDNKNDFSQEDIECIQYIL